jgi:hypothetical protein
MSILSAFNVSNGIRAWESQPFKLIVPVCGVKYYRQ